MNKKGYQTVSAEEFASALLKEDNVVYFAGSGVSMWSPSNLPTGWELKRNLFRGITDTNNLRHCFNWVYDGRSRMVMDSQWRKIPLEAIFGFIYEELGTKLLSRGLAFFGHKEFNIFHTLLVLLALGTKDRTIITTNFDVLFEAVSPGKVEPYCTTVPRHPPDGAVRLVKLHGTYARPESMILILKREGRGLQSSLREFLSGFLPGKAICFVGYSASEFDIAPILRNIAFSRVYWIEKNGRSVQKNERLLEILSKNDSLVGFDLCATLKEIARRRFPHLSVPDLCGHNDKSAGLTDFLSRELEEHQRLFLLARIFRHILRPTLSLRLLRKATQLSRRGQRQNVSPHVLGTLYYELAESYKEVGNYRRAKRFYQLHYKTTTRDPIRPLPEILRARKKIAEISLLRHEFKCAEAVLSVVKDELENRLREKPYNGEVLDELLWDCNLNDAGLQLWRIITGTMSQRALPRVENLLRKINDHAVSSGNIDVQAETRHLLACCMRIKGDLEQAYAALDEALEYFRHTGATMGEINTLREKANCLSAQGDYRKAIGIHKEILAISRQYDKDPATRLKSLLPLTYFCLMSGHLVETARYGTEGLLLLSWSVLFGWVTVSMIKSVAYGGLLAFSVRISKLLRGSQGAAGVS